MTLSQRLISYIEGNLLVNRDAAPIGEDDSLLERGLLDSISLFELMTFLEQETGVRVPDDEVLPENFESVKAMEALVRRLKERS